MKIFYAVKKGRETGIFMTQEECLASVDGFRGAVYKEFTTEQAARSYLSMPGTGNSADGSTECVRRRVERDPNEVLVAYTDGSANGKQYGWGVVVVNGDGSGTGYCGHGSKKSYLKCGSQAGELTAALKAMEYAIGHGYRNILIRHDFTGVANWANLLYSSKNRVAQSYSDLVDRMREYGLGIKFEKVKAHCGEWGNEQADKLALRGLNGESYPVADEGLKLDSSAPPIKTSAPTKQPSRTVNGPLALLLDDKAEEACVDAIRSMARMLDSMYGNSASQPGSISAQIDDVLFQSVPMFAATDEGDASCDATMPPQSGSGVSCDPDGTSCGIPAKTDEESTNSPDSIVADGDGQIRVPSWAAQALHDARRKGGLYVSQVAAACGMASCDLRRLERGMVDEINVGSLRRVAEEVQCARVLNAFTEADCEADAWLAEMDYGTSENADSILSDSVSAAPGEGKDVSNDAADVRTAQNNWDRVAELLRSVRRVAGISRCEVADACGISVHTLARIERGNIELCDTDIVRTVSEAIGCAPDVSEAVQNMQIPAPENKAYVCESVYTVAEYDELTRHIVGSLCQARTRAGLQISDIAEECDLSDFGLEMVERCAMMPISSATLRRIAEAVGCADMHELAVLSDMESSIWLETGIAV